MNNLGFFRETAGLTKKELASLMNVTVYTYSGFEDERMVMSREIVILIAKIYGISFKELTCDIKDISKKSLEKIHDLSSKKPEEKRRVLIFNLVGKSKNKVTYSEVEKIIDGIRKDVNKMI